MVSFASGGHVLVAFIATSGCVATRLLPATAGDPGFGRRRCARLLIAGKSTASSGIAEEPAFFCRLQTDADSAE
jgi:hypothetical protein